MRLMRMHGLQKAELNFFYDQIINRKNFVPGDKALLYNSRLHIFAGKLKTRWSGPFIVRTIFSHGVVVIVDLKSNTEFKVKRQRLKPFLTTEPASQAEIVLSLFAPSYT